MKIHEYQGKQILKSYGIPIQDGAIVENKEDIENAIDRVAQEYECSQFIVKAQIHAGGRGKAGGIKLVKNQDELISAASQRFGRFLVTPQTGPEGKEVKRLYIEEVSEVSKEFYLSCLVDRSTAKIAFISSTEGGTEIEQIAKKNPEKVITTKFDLSDKIEDKDFDKIINIFNLDIQQKQQARKIINSMFNILVKKCEISLISDIFGVNPVPIDHKGS